MTDHILKLEQQVMQAQAKQIRAEDEASNGSEPIPKSWHPFYEEKHHESPNR